VSPILLLLLASPAATPTIEIMRMHDIERQIEPGTLVIFDIDNTLIEPVQMLGSDQWFYALVEQIRTEQKVGEEVAAERAMALWNAVQADLEVRAVESSTPALLKRLAERDLPILALTARTFDIAETTAHQLRSVGIDFERHAVAGDLELALASPAKLIRGVLYVGELNSKGEVLVEFLRRTGLAPKKIVFVDDKRKHVESVTAELKAVGIPVIAYRYGGADASVTAFRTRTAEAQFREWQKRAAANGSGAPNDKSKPDGADLGSK
jgi:FMN phosphatase YigB (HAD superfamily)